MGLFREVKCGRCDRRYSSIRGRCPYCGARKNRGGKRAAEQGNKLWPLIAGVLVLIAIVVAVIILVSSSLKNNKDPDPTPTITVKSDDGVVEVTATPRPTTSATPEPTPTPTPEATVSAITLNREDFTLSFIGEQWTMTATLSPASSQAEIKWSSEDESIAIINASGVVTAIDRGVTNVVCEAGGKTAKCVVRVNADSILGNDNAEEEPTDEGNTGGTTGLSLSHTDVTIKSSNSESFTLTVSGTSASPSFSSNDTNVATVSPSGTVKAISKGTATIKVSVGGETLKCIVRVS